MGEWSKSAHTERMGRLDRHRVDGVRMIIRAIQDGRIEPDHEPTPEIDTRIPGKIGSVLLPQQLQFDFTQTEPQ